MFSPEELKRAVELYPTTSTTTAEVVEHLGYPTRQCLERWLAKDPRYAGRMRSPIIPMETRQKAIEPVLGGMRQRQAARRLGVGVGAVAHWVKAYRGAAWPRCRPGTGTPRRTAGRRSVEEMEPGELVDAGGGGGSRKKLGADPRLLSNKEKTLQADRLRPAYSLGSMTCLLGIEPSCFASTFRALPDYMVWYRNKRIKTKFGMSIMDRRRILGLVA